MNHQNIQIDEYIAKAQEASIADGAENGPVNQTQREEVKRKLNNQSSENSKSSKVLVENVKKDKTIDYMFIFFIIRLVHFFIYYFKYLLELIVSHPKFEKNQILWWFPIFKENESIQSMNNKEFNFFIIGYINKFEREVLQNNKINESYRLFIDDVVYNFEWNLSEKSLNFEEKHFSRKYSFNSDLHYLIEIILKLHLPISKNKIRDTINDFVELYDSFTESPQNNKFSMKDYVYNMYQYLQGELYGLISKGFSYFGSVDSENR